MKNFKWCKIVMLIVIKCVIQQGLRFERFKRYHIDNNVKLILKHSLNIMVGQCIPRFLPVSCCNCVSLFSSWKVMGVDLALYKDALPISVIVCIHIYLIARINNARSKLKINFIEILKDNSVVSMSFEQLCSLNDVICMVGIIRRQYGVSIYLFIIEYQLLSAD